MTRVHKSVIMLEFNELSPALVRQFIAEGHLPNFQKLYEQSRIFITDAEERPPNLEPWIQWVTVHSGLSYTQHGIFHLGEGHKLKSPQIWDLFSNAGYKVWICGSMNVRYDTPLNGAILPDPWSSTVRPHPQGEFEAFIDFVRRHVHEHTNDHVPVSKGDYFAFLSFMLAHGLSSSTVFTTLRQLLSERRNPKARWRRATILDRLQWDVFKHRYRRERPGFSTFFLNSTAHFQHMYWRNMEPDVFTVRANDDENAEFGDAVCYGYREMDRIVGEALSLADDGRTAILLVSALSQQPCLTYEEMGGKRFYRPRALERVLEFAGIKGAYQIEPVMSEQFQVRFETTEAAASAATALNTLKVAGLLAMGAHHDGRVVYTGCSIFDHIDDDAIVVGPGGRAGFHDLFYRVEGMKSGMHHPDGLLWISEPGVAPSDTGEKVHLRDVAPTVLKLLDVQPLPEMSGRTITAGEIGTPAERVGSRAVAAA